MPRRMAFATLVILLLILILVAWQPRLVSDPPIREAETLETVLHPPSAVTATLSKACKNCHSNQTSWPWYAHLRPVASRISSDVRQGRKALNFSEWKSQTHSDRDMQAKTLQTSCTLMQAGMMPPPYYLYIHPDAKLTNNEIRQFCTWSLSIQTGPPR
jgi:hypothetical protein